MSNDAHEVATYRGAQPIALVHSKRPVRSALVVVLDTHREDRGLHLEDLNSRALLQGEIHELIVTDEAGAGPGTRVDRIAYLGFVEVKQGGVLHVGDRIQADGADIGALAGFDLTHFPNHLNIVVRATEARSGAEMGLGLGAEVTFTMAAQQ